MTVFLNIDNFQRFRKNQVFLSIQDGGGAGTGKFQKGKMIYTYTTYTNTYIR